MGLTQHRQAVATIREIVNTMLLRGSIGRRGAGLCPVRGHSNVQGDRTMGIVERPTDALLDALAARFSFEPPRRHGYDTVATIAAMAAGDVDVFVGLGGNFAAAAPDTDVTAAALERCALTVQVSTKLNRSHVHCGAEALILPCLGRTEADRRAGLERFVTVEDSMGIVHATRGANEPASPHLRSEVDIVCAIATATLGDDPIDWEALADDYDDVREHIAATIPGFADFNERVRRSGGFALPNPPRDTTTFPTATGRARLSVNVFEPISVPPGRLLLQTVRSHDQFNTTIYGLDDRYRGVRGGRRVVFINPTISLDSASPTATSSTSSASGPTAANVVPATSGSSPTRRTADAARPTSRRPTCWFRSTASPRAAARRRRRPSSSASSRLPRARRCERAPIGLSVLWQLRRSRLLALEVGAAAAVPDGCTSAR